jgi:hypothetical protein
MSAMRHAFGLVLLLSPVMVLGQGGSGPLPDVSATVKGTLVLPIPVGNPLFGGYTETIGQVDGVFQAPLLGRWGMGVGGNMTWFAVSERALAPVIIGGSVQRITGFAKLQYEEYTTRQTFIELSLRAGFSHVMFECATCSDQRDRTVPHLAAGFGYYLHASDNLAFGLTMGYGRDITRFSAADLGLEGFPGRREKEERRDMQQLTFGLGFSTRLRRSDDGPRGW